MVTNFNYPKSKAGLNYLLLDEDKKLFKFLKNRKDKQAERDYVLLTICRVTGLRRAEAVALNVEDVMGTETIEVNERIAKKGAIGFVYLPKSLQEIIQRFLRLKQKWGESLADGAPLFVSKKKKRLSIRSFKDIMDKWCKEAGIHRYTPHALRHTKAQRIMSDVKHLTLEEQRKALIFANKQLRHRSLNSTLVYTMPTKEEMMKVRGI